MERTSRMLGIALLVLAVSAPAGTQEFEWVRQFGGVTPSFDACYDVDIYGDIYVCGLTTGALPGQTSSGGYDGYIRRYDSAGNEIWTRQFGTEAYDQATRLAVDNTGVYVVGLTSGVFPGQIPIGDDDCYIRKYDLDGNVLWTRQFGTTGEDWATCVFVHTSGVYVGGAVTGAFPGQQWEGDVDCFLRRYDTDGVEAWTVQYGSPDFDMPCGVAVFDNEILVTGLLGETVLPLTTATGFLHKYDVSGDLIWERQFPCAGADVGYYLSADRSGIYVCGYTDGALAGWSNAGGIDAILLKYDTEGNEVWDHQLGTPGRDHGIGVCADNFGVYLEGMTDGVLPGQTNAGLADDYVQMLTHTGCVIWTYQFGTSGFEAPVSAAAQDACVYTVGWTSGTFPGQTTWGYADAYLTKIVHTNPENLLLAMVDAVKALNVHQGIENSLDAKLGVALKALQDLKENNDMAAVNALQAFINEVEGQRGNKIAEGDADALIAAAQHILDLLANGAGQQSIGTPVREAERLVLYQNWPNPFRDRTSICFTLPEQTHATLTIHDVAGRTISTLVDSELPEGTYTFAWEPAVAAGVYFYRIEAAGCSASRRLCIVR